jgi:hypothetical protein
MTYASHHERQFMQYLRGEGWIRAGALPPSPRLVENLLNKGWIEQQGQGPKNETYFRLTDKGLEAKREPVPTGKAKTKVQLGPGKDPARAFRLSDDFMARVDAWAAKQDGVPGRSEAIRRLVELGLKVKGK